jgi:hypothetical protein
MPEPGIQFSVRARGAFWPMLELPSMSRPKMTLSASLRMCRSIGFACFGFSSCSGPSHLGSAWSSRIELLAMSPSCMPTDMREIGLRSLPAVRRACVSARCDIPSSSCLSRSSALLQAKSNWLWRRRTLGFGSSSLRDPG